MASFDAIPQLLAQLTTPNTEAIRAAESALKPLLKSPQCIPPLMNLLTNLQSPPAVRQITAVVLRKKIPNFYDGFNPQDKQGFKAALLQMLQTEPERSVRISAVAVVAEVANFEIKTTDAAGPHPNISNNWPEVLQFIVTANQNPAEEARELAFFLLAEMTYTIGNCLKESFADLAQLYNAALQDQSVKVKTAALKALGMIMAFMSDEPEVQHFAGLIPLLLNSASECQSRGDEEVLQLVNDVMYDLCHCNESSVTIHTGAIVQFCLQELLDTNLELVTRDSAALVISTLSEFKPKLMAKKCDVPMLVDTFMNLIEISKESAAGAFFDNNPNWREDGDESDDEDDYDGPTQCGMAQGCLDMIACNLPQKHVFNTTMTKCVQRMQSQNPPTRKAGIASLGVVAEGCQEKLSDNLREIMPFVFQCAGDGDAQVRECACFTLGQLAEHCQPEILDYAEQILPAVFKLLDDTTVSVQVTSCYVLEMFCEHLEPYQILPFLDPLTRKLVAMLEVATRKCVKEMSVAALAATAVAAEKEFIPYLPGVANFMGQLMALSKEEDYPLKGRAMECMGHMAVAVEKEAFRPYFQHTMQHTCEALTLDSVELHEYAYAVFANLSKVMEREFSPVLPDLVPHLWKLIGDKDGGNRTKEELQQIQDLIINRGQQGKGGQLSGLDDSDEEGDAQNFQPDASAFVTTAMLEAKKAAITALGEMANHCGQDFMPYIEKSAESLKEASTYWHPTIKAEVCRGYPALVVCSVAAHHPDGKVPWEKGNVNHNPMSAHTAGLANAVLLELIPNMQNPEQEVVAVVCEALGSVIELCGPAALVPVANDILQGILMLLENKAPCQEAYDEEDDEDDEDEHENFMNAVMDLLGSVARVMGAQLGQFLPNFLPAIQNYAKASRPTNDRSMAIGCLGELAQGCEQAIMPSWSSVFLPIIHQGLADEEFAVKRNAAFTLGVCAEALKEQISTQYPALLQALSPLFTIDPNQSDSAAACKDNAAAAIARMSVTCPAAMPFAQVLPIFLQALPLKSDWSENETVYGCLVKLVQNGQPDVLGPLKGEVTRVVGAAMQEAKVDDEIKENLKSVFGV
ncbi:hypothetical protein TrVE_jg9354 [Triparma verrucosa]|uniref:Importin N-terminal domain-containing protein n=1 Tax=Triparma verrucosa TaxID=1606542 RepID=A0A9W7DLV6_9STRA|nr:hypothetical protein TrVE_jg9354 [Triparma verrucosa]